MNGGYDLHVQSGRWIQSFYELKVAHYLWERHIPFCSGIDPLCKIPFNSNRSDDFVIPPRPGLDNIQHRLEITGMSGYDKDGEAKKYMKDKQEIHNYYEDDEAVDHRIIPKPRNGTAYSQAELHEYLGDIADGTPEMVQNHDRAYPPLRPGSTYETAEAMLDDIRERFEPKTEISYDIVVDAFGTSFWHKLWEFFPNQTMHEVAKSTGMKSKLAPYNETKEQFLKRVRGLVEEFDGVLPTSHQLGRMRGKKWITVQYLRHFDSWGEMLEELGQPPNRTTNSLDETKVLEDLVALRKASGKPFLTITELQRMKGVDEAPRKKGWARYVWLKNNCTKAGYPNAKSYMRALFARVVGD